MAVTAWSEEVSADMAAMVAEGVNSFKFFMAYKNALMVSDQELIQGFRRCRELGVLAMVHAENGAPAAHALARPCVFAVFGPHPACPLFVTCLTAVHPQPTVRCVRIICSL